MFFPRHPHLFSTSFPILFEIAVKLIILPIYNLSIILFFSLSLRVIESKHKDYSKGDLVLTYAGWTTHSVSDGHRIPFGGWTKDMYKPDGSKMEKVDFLEDLPPSLALGVLGMTGYVLCNVLLF